jgi:MFS transporter, putative metabolite:H+ symporter
MTVTNFKTNHTPSYIYFTVASTAFGYFVNIYNLISFSIVGKTTLSLYAHTANANMNDVHSSILLIQMTGALVGSLIWGIIGDRLGRVSGLFISTLICVGASFACAFLSEVSDNKVILYYKIFRFISGVGLAGELGVGIAMVSEVTHKFEEDARKSIARIIGTTLVISLGVLGGSVAAFIADGSSIGERNVATLSPQELDELKQSCTDTYLVGALLGLILLLLRTSIFGSNLYRNLKYSKEKYTIKRGKLRQLFNKEQLKNLALCCTMSLPTWFVLGFLLENREYFGYVSADCKDTATYGWSYFGLAIGNLVSGVLSYRFKAYKKVLLGFHCLSFISIIYYIFGLNYGSFALKCFLLGTGCGYWSLFLAIIPEHFGTNMRCLASTFAINSIRFLVVPYTLILMGLTQTILYFNPIISIEGKKETILNKLPLWYHQVPAMLLAIALFLVSYFMTTRYFKETYGKSLDFETL